MTTRISLFPHIKDVENATNLTVEEFLKGIKDGLWQDDVLAVRNGKLDKSKVPYATVSGTFKRRNNASLTKHSGFICIDFDKVEDIDDRKAEIGADQYTYAIFTSVSGHGFAVLVKIDPKLHDESFDWLNGYYVAKYGLHLDIACRDISRPRYVSYDPDLYINHFSLEVKVEARKKEKPQKFVFVDDDFQNVLKQIVDRRLDLTSTYHEWRDLGFAIADKFGEEGREYFQQISQFHPEYTRTGTDKQFDNCMKGRKSRVITISTFFWRAKQAGCQIYSEKTETIIRSASLAKKDRTRKMDNVVPALLETGKIEPEDQEAAQQIVEQVYKEDNIGTENSSIVLDIKEFLNANYVLRRNEITRNIEVDGKLLDDIQLNTIFIDVKTVIDKASKDLVSSILFSDFTPSYNPFHEFFKEFKDLPQPKDPETGESLEVGGLALRLCSSIVSDTENYHLFMLKWLVSLIATIHKRHSPLLLVFTGGQNTGKTYWFRNLLPKKLLSYYAESTMDGNQNDAYILMSKKLIIMDDEFGGKNKKEEKRMKEILSKQTFSIREPYGRIQVDLDRLCMMAGTTNDEQILNDPTGNRRILPINVQSIHHDVYNSVCKDALFMDLYRLYLSGWNYELTKEEIEALNASGEQFEDIPLEVEMFHSEFRKPEINERHATEALTNSQILNLLQMHTKKILSPRILGSFLKKEGFHRYQKKDRSVKLWVYDVVRKN